MAIDGEEVHYLEYPNQGGSYADKKRRYEESAAQSYRLQQAYRSDEYLQSLFRAITDAVAELHITIVATIVPGQIPDPSKPGTYQGGKQYFSDRVTTRTVNNALTFYWQEARRLYPGMHFNEPVYLSVLPEKFDKDAVLFTPKY